MSHFPAFRRKTVAGPQGELLTHSVTAFMLLAIGLGVAYPLYQVVKYPALGDYLHIFSQSRWLEAAGHSLIMTILSTLTATTCGFLYAYGLVRNRVPLSRFWDVVALLPLLSPPFVVAISYVLLFGARGLITYRLFGVSPNIYGWHGVWLVQTVTFFPYAYLLIRNVLESIPPKLEYAAQNLGASCWRVFWDVIFPLARPGVAGAALLVAISVLADFGNPIIIGGNYSLLPTESYMQIVGWYNLPAAASLAALLVAPALGLFALQQYWLKRRIYTTITGKGSGLQSPQVAPAERAFFATFCWLFGALIVLVYGTLAWGAFSKVWGFDWSLTLRNFMNLGSHAHEMLNSLKYSFYSAALTASLASVTSYIISRRRLGLNSLLDFLVTVPAAIPGAFIAIGYILAFNRPPLVLTGTGAIMVLALTFWNLPMGYRASTVAMQQVDITLEKASQSLGAGFGRTFLRITLPLMKSAFIAAFTMGFLRSVTNLSITVFLAAPKTIVGTVSILSLVNNGAWGEAAAATVILIVIALLVLQLSVWLLGGRRESIFSS